MQFHHNGYVSQDPRCHSPNENWIHRTDELPDEMDVLIVGSGPAGAIAAAQLSMFPQVRTHIIERRDGRLVLGQADGIQSRSVETFQAFGFASEITEEAYRITEMSFWNPDPENPNNIVRGARPIDDEHGISEFPHLIVNQARVLDYFLRFAQRSPTQLTPNYGWEFNTLTVEEGHDYPVKVELTRTAGEDKGATRTVRAKYVIGCDGAHSGVRKSIQRKLEGDQANQAWGVMDVVVDTDFPDWRTKCSIHSKAGSILHIPREGGYLARMYVDLGVVSAADSPEEKSKIRQTPVETIIEKANQIMEPYTIDVKNVAWSSIYEVGHRLVDGFDDADHNTDSPTPRVFLTGDACHTHSAKAGQGMNVSMQDGWNIAWKLGHVLSGRAPESLLLTYHTERQPAAANLIRFDKEWSTLMATPVEKLDNPTAVEDYYVAAEEFAAGFLTEYTNNAITADTEHQELAAGTQTHGTSATCTLPMAATASTSSLIAPRRTHQRKTRRWRASPSTSSVRIRSTTATLSTASTTMRCSTSTLFTSSTTTTSRSLTHRRCSVHAPVLCAWSTGARCGPRSLRRTFSTRAASPATAQW